MPPRSVDLIAATASRQGGAIAHRQLLLAGLSADQVDRWVAAGRLHPRHEGVFGLGIPLVDAEGITWAATLAVGEDAVVSHASLQVRLGIARFDPRAKPHVTVARRSGIEQPDIVVHRVRHLDPEDVVVVRGLRCTTPARLLLDEAERVSERALRRLVRELKVRGLVEDAAVQSVLARARGRHGLKRLRQVWASTSGAVARTASAPEADLLALCLAHDLPEPCINEPVRGAERRWRADALWRDEGLVVEVDSWEYHGFDDAFEDDHRKDEDLRARGLAVLRFTAARVAASPAQVARSIGAELDLRRRALAAGLIHPTWVG